MSSGGNRPGGSCPRGQSSGGQLSSGGNRPGGSCPRGAIGGQLSSGGNRPGGSCPRGAIVRGAVVLGGQSSGGQLSSGGNRPGGSSPGGNCPGGNCPDTDSDSLSTFFYNFPVLTPSSKQIKLALIFSSISKSVNPGSHLTNPICKVKERVGEVWAADMSGGRHRHRSRSMVGLGYGSFHYRGHFSVALSPKQAKEICSYTSISSSSPVLLNPTTVARRVAHENVTKS